jgi:hypothetical protein
VSFPSRKNLAVVRCPPNETKSAASLKNAAVGAAVKIQLGHDRFHKLGGSNIRQVANSKESGDMSGLSTHEFAKVTCDGFLSLTCAMVSMKVKAMTNEDRSNQFKQARNPWLVE